MLYLEAVDACVASCINEKGEFSRLVTAWESQHYISYPSSRLVAARRGSQLILAFEFHLGVPVSCSCKGLVRSLK